MSEDHAGAPASVPSPEPGAVLIVEDDEVSRLLLAVLVEDMGRRVLLAANGWQALETLLREKCDLVLLDVMMPEMDGQELLSRIKEREELRNIPVIIISGLDEDVTAARCIEIGAEDFLNKPFNPLVLRARINASLERKRLHDQEAAYLRQLLDLQQSLDRRNRELEELNAKLVQAALTDHLTGLPNRRWAMDELNRCWQASTRYHRPMGCLIADVDHFKRINDTFGHDAGDAVLQEVAHRLKSAARLNEGVARLGGEEFLVVCEFTDREGAAVCGERLRAAVAGQPVVYQGQEFPITISLGAAVRDDAATHPEQLLKMADRAVYAAKQAGRNRVCVAPARS